MKKTEEKEGEADTDLRTGGRGGSGTAGMELLTFMTQHGDV